MSRASILAMRRFGFGGIDLARCLLVLSRFSSGLSTHLCDLSLESQGGGCQTNLNIRKRHIKSIINAAQKLNHSVRVVVRVSWLEQGRALSDKTSLRRGVRFRSLAVSENIRGFYI